jgi:magnesium transporter
MRWLVKRTSKKAGLPPGTLLYVGEERDQQTKITVLEYDEQHVSERELRTVAPSLQLPAEPTVTWINVDGLQTIEVIEHLGERFGLHSLVLEDILNTAQRPKMEDFGDYLYIVLKMLYPSEKGTETLEEQVSLILGTNYVLSVQECEGDVFTAIREHIRHARGRVRKMGADYLAYALVDAIVDGYFVALERLGDRIEFLEEELVINPTTSTLHTIHDLKTQMVFLRKSVWPLREVIHSLERGEPSLIRESTAIYLRDVYDHTIQVIDTIESLRDIVSGMLDIYLSSVSNRMNEVMKVLTVIATMFIPLTFLAGVYGMNFEYMPELQWRWSYPLLWLVMAGVVILMSVYFRRKGWL